jgi:hypothetical protein
MKQKNYVALLWQGAGPWAYGQELLLAYSSSTRTYTCTAQLNRWSFNEYEYEQQRLSGQAQAFRQNVECADSVVGFWVSRLIFEALGFDYTHFLDHSVSGWQLLEDRMIWILPVQQHVIPTLLSEVTHDVLRVALSLCSYPLVRHPDRLEQPIGLLTAALGNEAIIYQLGHIESVIFSLGALYAALDKRDDIQALYYGYALRLLPNCPPWARFEERVFQLANSV